MDTSRVIVHVPFNGQIIDVARVEGKNDYLVALKRACENLGIEYTGQFKRLKDQPWATVGVIPMVADDGKEREMVCIDRQTLVMWLATIDTTRLKSGEARDTVARYQRECAKALDAYFFEPAPSVESLLGDPDFAIRAFTALRDARARADSLERENATLRPRAALAETALDLEGDQSLTKASRYLRQVDPRMTRGRLVALLRGDGMLCQRDPSPTREAIDRGYLVQKMPRYEGSDGAMRMGSPYAHVTAKGLDWMARRYCVVAPLRLVEGVA